MNYEHILQEFNQKVVDEKLVTCENLKLSEELMQEIILKGDRA